MTSLESRFSVLDFVLQLWRKLQNGKPGFEAVARLSGERRSVYAARLVHAHRLCENTNGGGFSINNKPFSQYLEEHV